jgi:acetyl esterase/lipase
MEDSVVSRSRLVVAVAGVAVTALALAGCSSAGGGKSGGADAAATKPCPTASAAPPASGTGGVPAGPPPAVSMARTVRPADISTSTVIHPGGGPQIRCGVTDVAMYHDVVYATPATGGKAVPLRLDLQVPKGAGDKPLVVYITGGGFVTAMKEGNLDQRTYIAEQGYAVASIQYRTVTDGATYTDGIEDVKSAIRYLRANAGRYGFDATKTAVWGQSAGGYLASMVGVTNGLTRFDVGDHLNQRSDVQAVVDEFGATDLATLGEDFDTATQQQYSAPGNPFAQYLFGPGTTKSVLDDPAVVAAANPITYIDKKTAPPFLILHGSQDHLISASQTVALQNALSAKGVTSTRYVLDGANHGDLGFMGDPTAVLPWSTQLVMGDIAGFLAKQTR